ncbi:FAD-dependent oxidoreductase [Eremococcus coleocola]|uniref:FAD-dependent oxidoreductase n=1 Tax=Eremococcus coleocola TaxID=88132 RepID=UPI0024A91833|nr:FAD-dependent oxidoreductase [Eremococcus coleocola]
MNLWAAGRMISSDSMGLGSVRVMGTAFATGQAAGIGATLSTGENRASLSMVQNEFRKQKALI